jgi:uncharacterized protein (DUF2236 family)
MAGRRIAPVGLRSALLGAIGLDLPPLEPGRPGDPGLFGPSSEVWRIGRERVLLAGGAAALLLQIAHPLVATGVAEHSDFPRRAFDRLRSTLDATLRITFGDRDQAADAAASVRGTHARVRGTLAEAIGDHPAGTSYDAADPELALWVHATLIVTALGTYRRLVGPLTAEARSRYYEEAKAFGGLFGVSEALMPQTLQDFHGYVRRMVQGEALAVGEIARTLARDIIDPPVPAVLAAGRPLNRLVTASLLPRRVREGFGLGWSALDRSAFATLSLAARLAVPALPPALRFWGHYRAAVRRVGLGYAPR